MRNAIVFIGALIFALTFTGCQTTYVESHDMNIPIAVLDQAVETALSMGVAGYSENHREFYSRPFQVLQSDEAKARGFRERGLAKVTILGDSRPYTIESEVKIEHAKILPDQGAMKYYFARYDKRLAERLLGSVLNSVNHRERDKNVIDDFQSF